VFIFTLFLIYQCFGEKKIHIIYVYEYVYVSVCVSVCVCVCVCVCVFMCDEFGSVVAIGE